MQIDEVQKSKSSCKQAFYQAKNHIWVILLTSALFATLGVLLQHHYTKQNYTTNAIILYQEIKEITEIKEKANPQIYKGDPHLRVQLAYLESSLKEAKSIYSKENPKLLSLQEKLKDTQSELSKQIRSQVAALKEPAIASQQSNEGRNPLKAYAGMEPLLVDKVNIPVVKHWLIDLIPIAAIFFGALIGFTIAFIIELSSPQLSDS